MKKVFYLKTCGTNKKIMTPLDLSDWELREIKSQPVTEAELEEMYDKTKSYEALFSKKAQLYKSLGLKDKNLTEVDFKKYLLEHYTFLSRPVVLFNDEIFIGNTQPNVLKLTKALQSV